jgi:hypothetical protein
MNANLLIDKLKIKVKETNEIAQETIDGQNNLTGSIKELNFKISNYIESDLAQKRLYNENNEKFIGLRKRVDTCKDSMRLLKEKLHYLHNKLVNKPDNNS